MVIAVLFILNITSSSSSQYIPTVILLPKVYPKRLVAVVPIFKFRSPALPLTVAMYSPSTGDLVSATAKCASAFVWSVVATA